MLVETTLAAISFVAPAYKRPVDLGSSAAVTFLFIVEGVPVLTTGTVEVDWIGRQHLISLV